MSAHQQLADLDQEQLNDLLWRRLRLEEPLDPPLDRRFRMEAPEELFIEAWRQSEPPEPFKRKLQRAIRENLRRAIQLTAGETLDASDNEQLASLAFLADAVNARDLATDFYTAALYADVKDGINEQTRFHLLRTLAGLQTDQRLIPYWKQLWESFHHSISHGCKQIHPPHSH